LGTDINLLILSAATIAFFHTLMGPDHYLPLVSMAKANGWRFKKTVAVTLACGIGHIVGSIAIGFIGVLLSVHVSALESLESVRGEMAAWALIAVGLLVTTWGVHKALRNKPHSHFHAHGARIHSHPHVHHEDHVHLHAGKSGNSIAPWAIFIVFVVGPCEPLIPLLMYPAATASTAGLLMVTFVFGLVTMLTMLAMVCVSAWGISFLKLPRLERFSHAIAGCTILLCGCSIQFLGL
jgi:sulfite exporter TauE/SafE